MLPVAFSPELYHSFWAPKAAVCLALVGPGLVALAHLVRSGSRAAVLAALFLATVAASAVAASGPWVLAVTGAPNWGTGLLFAAAVVGSWAIGAVTTDERRRQLLLAIVAAAVVNAVVAWLQARDLVPPALESPQRSAGLMGNPIHLGALAAGGVWLVADLIGRRRATLWWTAPLVLLAGAAQVSGGRSAVGLSVLAVLAALPRAGLHRGAAIVAAVLLGLWVAPVEATEGTVSGSSRVVGSEATAQVDLRGTVWRISLDAALDRPVLGWGPGRFQAATSPRTTATMSEKGVSIWKDAHNWVVEYAVTTGFLGLGLLGAWLVASGWRARGPLAGFAAAMAAFLLVEPQSVGITPLALLALGASMRGPPASPVPAKPWGVLAMVGLAAGLAAGAVLVTGEALLRRGQLDTSVRDFERGAALLPAWADVSRLGGRIQAFDAIRSPALQRKAIGFARQATRREPEDPLAWTYLGQLELVWGSESEAGAALRRARERNPWLAEALTSSAVLARRTGDQALLDDSCRRLGVLGRTPTPCEGPATVEP